MSIPLVTINLVVLNGKKYIRHCLDAIKNQTYKNLEVNIFDNGSTDGTVEEIKNWKLTTDNLQQVNFFENKINLGMWGGQEKALEYSRGKYIVALSVDVLMMPDAIEKAVEVMEKDPKNGALEAKILQYKIENGEIVKTNLIDTLGFRIERSRRITNLGHGVEDEKPNSTERLSLSVEFGFNKEREIFAVEGAAPIFRKEAFEDCRIVTGLPSEASAKEGEIMDHDMWWYGDDIDLGWRMRLFGWKQIYSPEVVMYHDRSTTKGMSRGWKDYLKRIKERRRIPIRKRRLDWRNKKLARLKNDYWQNVFHDLLWILKREILELGYITLFEPSVLLEIPKLVMLIPKTLSKRRAIMAKAAIGPQEMQKWFK